MLDPFIGSGTSAIAASGLGRKYIGIEIQKEYCQLAESRLKSESRQLVLMQKIRKYETT